MTTKVLQNKVLELEERLRKLEASQNHAPGRTVAQAFDDLESVSKRRDKILTRTAGAWKQVKLDPVAWQRKARKAWGKKLKRQTV